MSTATAPLHVDEPQQTSAPSRRGHRSLAPLWLVPPRPATRPLGVPTAPVAPHGQPARATRTAFAAVLALVVVSGFGVLLLLNTTLAQGAFAVSALQAKATAAGDHEQELAARLSRLEAPGTLAARARGLGLVPGGNPAFIDPQTGKVLGESSPATAPPQPTPKPKAATAAAKPATAKPETAKPATAKPAAPKPATAKAAATPTTGASSG